jgi:transcriptional regulator with XRE-family HTH domain
MTIAPRIRKIREVRGWKQAAVASAMSITQQAYSFLEQGYGSPRISTLERFCDVMKVEVHFLLAQDVPITEENIEKYGGKGFFDLINNYRQMEQKLEVYHHLIMNTDKATKMQVSKDNANK